MARATHLSVKSLRHYHDLGLLVPADIDPQTGYRRYTAEQISTASVIRRFRELDMPLAEIREVLGASDAQVRNAKLASHLTRLQTDLARTRQAVDALNDLLHPPRGAAVEPIEIRRFAATPVAAITATVDADEGPLWVPGALGEIRASLTAQELAPDGPAGGAFADELFTEHRGRVTVFVPCSGPVRPTGRIEITTLPEVEAAVIVHRGRPQDASRSYGRLAAFVARHAVTVEGPIREHYLVDRQDTPEETAWRTEICWPVFPVAPAG